MAQWAGLIMLGDRAFINKQREFFVAQEEEFDGLIPLENSTNRVKWLSRNLKAGDTLFIMSKADFVRLKIFLIILNELNRLGVDIWFYND
ncbi:hypothetical protein [Campylobacter curvus]|uniref:hypothetical protein n=1 Tax=Campylobacter curvus TaxID=200 RepID=UPI0014702B69|nr:hypothetical protein [Campylobacter curvus]